MSWGTPREKDQVLNVFSGGMCEEKVLGSDSNERPTAYYIAFYCLLYCIILSTGFTVKKLYYVSILFYYASVFDFPKYKKCFYCFMLWQKKKILPSLKCHNFSPKEQKKPTKNKQKQPNLV